MVKLKTITNSLSFWIIIVLVMMAVAARCHFGFMGIISWDMFGYYVYLPARFIYHDPGLTDLGWVQRLVEQYQVSGTLYHFHEGIGDYHVNRYTSGLSLLFIPAFFIAHLLAHHFGFAADGMSFPYQLGVGITGLLVFFIGLLALRRMLLEFFADRTVFYVILLLGLGTNLMEMSFSNAHNPHIFLFATYSLIIFLTKKWHDHPSYRYSVPLGLLIGWSTVTRPSEILSLLIPLLWGVVSWKGFTDKIKWLWTEQKGHLLAMFITVFLAGLPHLLYLKTYSGSFFTNTYHNPAEGNDWLSPHLWPFLFSFRKGWLLYTPLMIFALAGFRYVYLRKRTIFWPLLVFIILFIYLYASWTTWWFGYSFSQRNMIQAYPVLSLTLGFCLVWIFDKSGPVKATWISVIVFLVILNMFQTWQYSFAGILNGERVTPAYYFRIFGKTSVSTEDKKLLLIERSTTSEDIFNNEHEYVKRTLWSMDFEKPGEQILAHACDTLSFSGRYSLRMDSNYVFSPSFNIRYKELTENDHAWIRISARVYTPDTVSMTPGSLVISFQHRGNAGTYKYRTIDIENPANAVKTGKWNSISMNYLTPEVRSKKDKLVVYFWYRGKRPLYIDDLLVEAFEKKEP